MISLYPGHTCAAAAAADDVPSSTPLLTKQRRRRRRRLDSDDERTDGRTLTTISNEMEEDEMEAEEEVSIQRTGPRWSDAGREEKGGVSRLRRA